MKSIMVVDGAENCVYDVFAVPEDDCELIFPESADVAFSEDVERRPNAEAVFDALNGAWVQPSADARTHVVQIRTQDLLALEFSSILAERAEAVGL